MTSNTHHFLRIPLISSKQYSFAHKEHCLSSVCIGRRDFAAHLHPASPFQQIADSMCAWLSLGGVPG